MKDISSSKIRYIFSINTGRSGSEYLSRIFDYTENCISKHEDTPRGNSKPMISYWQGETAPMKELCKEKLKKIDSQLDPYSSYAESSHLFIKGFGWELPKMIEEEKIGIVVLRREKDKIVKSLYRVSTTPFTPMGKEWILGPLVKFPLVPTPKVFISGKATLLLCSIFKFILRAMNRFSKELFRREYHGPNWFRKYEMEWLSWYVDETEALEYKFKAEHPDITYYDISLEEINSYSGVKKMLNFFGLQEKPGLEMFVGTPVNLRN